MSEDLKQRLEGLATQAPTPLPPEGLWSRGLRRRRRRRAAGAGGAALAAVLVGGLAGVAVQSVDAGPAPAATGSAAIPTKVDAAGPWLPAMEPSSPSGPLSVLLGAERKNLLGVGSDGLVGVSARTGVYRFLDLPGRATGDDGSDSSDVALSPDGRWVAYWQEGAARRVVGAAAYDTRTGAVRRLPLASLLGVAPDSLNWVDDARVLVGWGTVTSTRAGQSTARSQPPVLWTPDGPAQQVGARFATLGGFRPAPGGLSASDGTAVELLDGDLRTSERHPLSLSQAQSPLGDVVVSAEPGVALVVSDSNLGRNRLLTGPLAGDGLPRSGRGPAARAVDLRPVDLGSLVPEAVLAASDAGHLLVLGHLGSNTRGVYSVDASTGGSRRLVTVPSQIFGADVQFASDLWDRAPVARPGAPWTPDPRWVAAGAGAVVLLGFTWWRRRRDVV